MNRGLRRRHRVLTGTLALGLPIGLVAALLVRPDPPIERRLPAVFVPVRASIECTIASSDELWGELAITTRFLEAAGSGDVRVELDPREPLRLPDLLVYWHPGAAAGAPLPDGAKLLGVLADDLGLPEEARSGGGSLLLYSLAHGEVVGRAELPPIPEGSPCP